MKKTRIGIEDLWKIRRPSGVSLSPDGAQAVCALTAYDMDENTSATSLWLLSRFGGEPRRLTQCGESDAQAAWSPDGRTIAFVAKRGEGRHKDEAPQLYAIPPDGGEARRITQLATGVSAIKWFPDSKRIACISWVWPDETTPKAQAARLKSQRDSKVKAYVTDRTQVRYWDHWLADGRVPHIHVIDVASGKCRDLFAGSDRALSFFDPDQHDFDIAPDGKTIAFHCNPHSDPRWDQPTDLVEMDVKTGRARILLKGGRHSYHHPRYSPDGHRIALLANHIARSINDDNKLALLDRRTGRLQIRDNFDRLVNHPLKWSPDGDAVYFTADQSSRLSLWRWQAASKNTAPRIVVQGGTVMEFDLAADTCAFVRNDMSHPPRVFSRGLDADDGGERPMEDFNDALMARFRLGEVRDFTIKGWNGEAVQMWAVYPPDFDPKKKWPLLHSIHGGPHGNWGDNFHFRWNNHVFAAQGYVVVCVNYHGSLGWGNRFLDSITGHYGHMEHADIEAGTDFMLKQGYIDPTRLAASGGSYGGKMVAWMNGRNGRKKGGDRYRAYICHAGCFDWRAMHGGDAGYWFAHSLGTTYWDDAEKFAAQNPITEVKHAKTPTLVIHGSLDYRVPDQQGLAYYATLKEIGTPARLVLFPDENHWILKPQNSRLWYREYFGWLKKYVGGGGRKA